MWSIRSPVDNLQIHSWRSQRMQHFQRTQFLRMSSNDGNKIKPPQMKMMRFFAFTGNFCANGTVAGLHGPGNQWENKMEKKESKKGKTLIKSIKWLATKNGSQKHSRKLIKCRSCAVAAFMVMRARVLCGGGGGKCYLFGCCCCSIGSDRAWWSLAVNVGEKFRF